MLIRTMEEQRAHQEQVARDQAANAERARQRGRDLALLAHELNMVYGAPLRVQEAFARLEADIRKRMAVED